MKNSNLALIGLYLISAVIAFVAPSCKKKDEVDPLSTITGITSVTSASVTLNNQNSDGNKFYKIATKSFVTSTDFDIAYGNGTPDVVVNAAAREEATSNLFFIGGPTSESVLGQYGVFGTATGTNYTEFYSVEGLTATKFDSLVNKLAIPTVLANVTGTYAESCALARLAAPGVCYANSRIKSSTAWPVGSVFAIKLSSGDWVLAKVTTAPTGTNNTAGSITLSLKW